MGILNLKFSLLPVWVWTHKPARQGVVCISHSFLLGARREIRHQGRLKA